MAAQITEQKILNCLEEIPYSSQNGAKEAQNLVSAGAISGIVIKDGNVIKCNIST